MEGGFNKVLLMTAENGKEVIAKLPCPRVVPPQHSTASEAAVMEYVRSHTSVPVCRVLGWSSEASNPVGSEYILMERACGRQLVDVWGEMNQLQQFRLVQCLVQLQSQLAALKFPAYGNMYFLSSDAQHSDPIVPMNDDYCVGPAYNASCSPQLSERAHAGQGLTDLGIGLVERGLAHLEHSSLDPRTPHFGTKSEHFDILTMAKDIIPHLGGFTPLQQFAKPTLWHSDLHMGNIYVSEQDPTAIVNVIDWQFTSIMPAFMQVQWPSFLAPPDGYEIGAVKPELPPNFEDMDADAKAFAISEREQALLSKCYEASLVKNHMESYLAMTQVDSAIRYLFMFAENTTKDGIIPLRNCLTQLAANWNEMGIAEQCPFNITSEALSKHQMELSRYKDWQKLKGYTQELLQTDDEGWISAQLDFEKVQARHAELFQLYIEKETEEISEEEARRLWFYLENT
ncbi:phosphotransferase family protein [Aspergillus tubingensis]|uniref:phosphotransferase family protein n=1 Tax=Aspergillus tubingensis TaxID=5068 RepID=UPI00157966E4|nr:serine/threonine protein kinase [Aspergillus tubingensis]GFN11624.1 serine/threonine protein kinase [Aspergillus tubingensis]